MFGCCKKRKEGRKRSLTFEKREDLTFESQTVSELKSAVAAILLGPWKNSRRKK